MLSMIDVATSRWGRLALAGFLSGLMFFGFQNMNGVKADFGCPAATIHGTSGMDDLQGDGAADGSHDHADTISAHGGMDRVRGYTCGDELHGGEGTDHVHGAHGNDQVLGENGSDGGFNCTATWCAELVGGDGHDTVEGSLGGDIVADDTGTSDTDTLRGGDDNDDLWSQDGDGLDTVNGGNGADDFCSTGPGDSRSNCERGPSS